MKSKWIVLSVLLAVGVFAGQKLHTMTKKTVQSEECPIPMKKDASTEDLKSKLSPEVYQVTQQKGTEPAFTGKYWNNHEKGMYKCTVCGADLFSSDTKFDSGTGWPSFWESVNKENIKEETDTSHGMKRTEVICKHCGAHLGHLFPDGPKPTGMRYCINSASLNFEKKK